MNHLANAVLESNVLALVGELALIAPGDLYLRVEIGGLERREVLDDHDILLRTQFRDGALREVKLDTIRETKATDVDRRVRRGLDLDKLVVLVVERRTQLRRYGVIHELRDAKAQGIVEDIRGLRRRRPLAKVAPTGRPQGKIIDRHRIENRLITPDQLRNKQQIATALPKIEAMNGKAVRSDNEFVDMRRHVKVLELHRLGIHVVRSRLGIPAQRQRLTIRGDAHAVEVSDKAIVVLHAQGQVTERRWICDVKVQAYINTRT